WSTVALFGTPEAARCPHGLQKAAAPLYYSIGARGLRASHTWSQEGQENVSVLKRSRIRTVRRVAHIGQAGSLDAATGVIGVSRADWSADDMRKTVRLTKKMKLSSFESSIFSLRRRQHPRMADGVFLHRKTVLVRLLVAPAVLRRSSDQPTFADR